MLLGVSSLVNLYKFLKTRAHIVHDQEDMSLAVTLDVRHIKQLRDVLAASWLSREFAKNLDLSEGLSGNNV